jgi:uncharacterized protein (TIGR03067 family)
MIVNLEKRYGNMKRRILLSLLLIGGVATVTFCARQKAATEEGLLKGAWTVTHFGRDGDMQEATGYEIMFGDDTFVATSSFRQGSAGTYSVNRRRQPNAIDMQMFEDGNANALVVRGIYSASKGTGKLCFVSSYAYPRPRAFSTTKGDGHTLLILKRLTETESEIEDGLPEER